MSTVTEAAPAREEPEDAATRLGLLGAVVLLPPLIIGLQAVRDDTSDIPVLVVGMVLLMLLVLTRVGLLMQSVAVTAERERTLRAAAAAFVAGGDRRGVHAAALDAVDLLLGGTVVVSRIVDLVDASGQEVIVTAGGRRLEASPKPVAPPVAAGSPSRPHRAGRGSSRWTATCSPGWTCAAAAATSWCAGSRVHDELLALVVVVTACAAGRRAPSRRSTPSPRSSGWPWSRRRSAPSCTCARARPGSGRWCRTPPTRSCWSTAPALVTYQGPSAERVLGYRPEALLGQRARGPQRPAGPAAAAVPADRGARPARPEPAHRAAAAPSGRRLVDVEAVLNNLQADPSVGATARHRARHQRAQAASS